jgi:hypothetical protein
LDLDIGVNARCVQEWVPRKSGYGCRPGRYRRSNKWFRCGRRRSLDRLRFRIAWAGASAYPTWPVKSGFMKNQAVRAQA